ncbi:MAG: tyrosine--tRNA ligase [Phycisphaerales bacterium]
MSEQESANQHPRTPTRSDDPPRSDWTDDPIAPPAASGRALLDELKWRGLFHQCTDEDGLATHLDQPRGVYCGFDPTADSLTIGNLVPIMLLAHFRRAGHRIVVVQGGATGRIGDPSGKEAERAIRADDEIENNLRKQRPIFEGILNAPSTKMDAPALKPIDIVDNYDWFKGIGFIQALRDIGKHFSVNEMIKRDSVRNRLEGREQGISYTEFSYVLLQAYDYLDLFRTRQVSVQAAGADQWGNIVSGCDLVRRVVGAKAAQEAFRDASGRDQVEYSEALVDTRQPGDESEPSTVDAQAALDRLPSDSPIRIAASGHAFGFTAPLLTKSDGTKFGKTESGAIWLSARRDAHFTRTHGTSAYAFFQFWLNADDTDVIKYLKIFTLLTHQRIDELIAITQAEPHRREAQRILAREATAMVHGVPAMLRAEAAGKALFSGEVADLDLETIDEAFVGIPSATITPEQIAGDGLPLVDALVLAGLAKSKRESREFLTAGGVLLNGDKAAPDDAITPATLLHDQVALIRRGKKQWAILRLAEPKPSEPKP